MPVASLNQRHINLARLQGSLSAHCNPDSSRSKASQAMAKRLPLSHATSIGHLPAILISEALLSQVGLGKPSRNAETILETSDDVFLYLGAFGYPATECGFLFAHTLERDHQDDGIATPFDSGALAGGKEVVPPPNYLDGVSFVRDHELPVGDYRNLLSGVISNYSPSSEEYLLHPEAFRCSCGQTREHPFGLSGGDHRTSIFELRIPQRVPLRPPHLLAVFVRKGYEIVELSALFASGVRIECYEEESDDNFFHALRLACINFIQEHLTR